MRIRKGKNLSCRTQMRKSSKFGWFSNGSRASCRVVVEEVGSPLSRLCLSWITFFNLWVFCLTCLVMFKVTKVYSGWIGCGSYGLGWVGMITVLGVFWALKQVKWSCASHMIIVPSVIAALTDGVPELKKMQLLEGGVNCKNWNFRGRIENPCQLWRNKL